MKKGVIVLAHGSKRIETEAILTSIVDMVREQLSDCVVEPAFLQFSKFDLRGSVENLVKKGIKDIVVMPMFLFNGNHVIEDIPHELEELSKSFDGVSISLTKHIGADKRIANIIVDRVNEI